VSDLPPPPPPTSSASSGGTPTGSGSELPPPRPEWRPAPGDPAVPFASRTPRPPRVGELTATWRIALIVTWILVFLAYMGVWKASEEIGIGTWWLGPRSDPQPLLVRLVPFFVTAFFGILASYNLRRLPWIGVAGAVVLAAIAVPDVSRQAGLALVEFVLAGAVLVVSLAALTGRYRAAPADPSDPAGRSDTADRSGPSDR